MGKIAEKAVCRSDNALLQTAFLAILPTGLSQDVKDNVLQDDSYTIMKNKKNQL